MLYNSLIALSTAAAATGAFVWSVVHFAHHEDAYYGGWLIVSGSAWFLALAFAASVLFHAGRAAAARQPVAAPAPAQVLAWPQREAPAGYVPMSQRPDPVTRIDLEKWTPPVV